MTSNLQFKTPSDNIQLIPGAANGGYALEVIDQRWLPHSLKRIQLQTLADAEAAIREMKIRGAPLIGVTAAFGLYFALLEAQHLDQTDCDFNLEASGQWLKSARPTAVNLAWAVDRVLQNVDRQGSFPEQAHQALLTAVDIADEDCECCYHIGLHGLPIIEQFAAANPDRPVNILTHCNAGWLACVNWGTATAPIYLAHQKGIAVHVWVDETRPRNQGASLTAWELTRAGIPHTVIVDNAGGLLMQRGDVDLVVVGSDRTTRRGDVANKIGTYLKALAAHAHQVPFYVALPSSSFDFSIDQGAEIPIEARSPDEVQYIVGKTDDGTAARVQLTHSPALNYGFDITPAEYITGLITERGRCQADETEILRLFPEAAAMIT